MYGKRKIGEAEHLEGDSPNLEVMLPTTRLERLLLSGDPFEEVVVPPEDERRLGLEVGHVEVLPRPLQSVQEGAHVADLCQAQLGVRDHELDLEGEAYVSIFSTW